MCYRRKFKTQYSTEEIIKITHSGNTRAEQNWLVFRELKLINASLCGAEPGAHPPLWWSVCTMCRIVKRLSGT